MKYLVRVRRGGKAHYWDETDTRCRMASTGGLSMRKYVVSTDTGGRLICHMCGKAAEPGSEEDSEQLRP